MGQISGGGKCPVTYRRDPLSLRPLSIRRMSDSPTLPSVFLVVRPRRGKTFSSATSIAESCGKQAGGGGGGGDS